MKEKLLFAKTGFHARGDGGGGKNIGGASGNGGGSGGGGALLLAEKRGSRGEWEIGT